MVLDTLRGGKILGAVWHFHILVARRTPPLIFEQPATSQRERSARESGASDRTAARRARGRGARARAGFRLVGRSAREVVPGMPAGTAPRVRGQAEGLGAGCGFSRSCTRHRLVNKRR